MAKRTAATGSKRSLRSQKQQTILQFSPLPTSSPAKAGYGPDVQGRLANMRYGAVQDGRPRADRVQSSQSPSLPTPAPSSQPATRDRDQDATKVAAAPSLPSSPPLLPGSIERADGDSDDDEEDVVPSASKRRRVSTDIPSDTMADSATRRSTRLSTQATSKTSRVSRLSRPNNSHASPTPRRSGRVRPGRSPPQERLSRGAPTRSRVTEEPSSPPAVANYPSSRMSELGSPESTDEDDVVLASTPLRRRQKRNTVLDDLFVVDDDQVDDQLEYVSRTKTPKSRGTGSDMFVVDDDVVEYLSSADDAPIHPRHRSHAQTRPSSARRRRKSPSRSKKEQDELEEDLLDLRDSDQDSLPAQPRTRGGPVTTERDRTRAHLDLLRRRRAGEQVPRVSDTETDRESDLDVELGLIGSPAHDLSDQGSIHSSLDTDDDDEAEELEPDADEGFVINDSRGGLDRPHPDIPLQFTSFASAKPRTLFPHIIEWLVKNKIAPAFSRDDEVYNLALARVDDQVKAQAGSRLISAAWGTTFKRAILARPHMEVVALEGADDENIRDCDACNRSGHPARYEFVFSGEPYYKKTLEPVDQADDDDDDDEVEDDASRDEMGHALAAQTRRFYLGRFCAANAEMGHKLTHWKWHLNDSLMTYLEEQGVLSAEVVVAREKTSKKQREKEAESIVDAMQETGVIAELWTDFENDLNDARLGMEDFEKRGGRSRGRVGAIRSMG